MLLLLEANAVNVSRKHLHYGSLGGTLISASYFMGAIGKCALLNGVHKPSVYIAVMQLVHRFCLVLLVLCDKLRKSSRHQGIHV